MATLGPTNSCPLVSVIVATYNRAHLLESAIRSVQAQSISDWELIVVGDACTDHTEAVVSSFNDDRIAFYNRSENHGEQSVPNNEGVARARGRFLAYLNHDDLWCPDHLQIGIDILDREPVDLVYALRAVYRGQRVGIRGHQAVKRGLLCDGIPFSTIIFRREIAASVGPQHSAYDLPYAPSRDWIARALDQGVRTRSSGRISVVVVPSTLRAGSYVRSNLDDYKRAGELLDPLRRAELELQPPEGSSSPIQAVGRAILEPLLIAVGRHPANFYNLLQRPHFWRRGNFIRHARVTRGLTAEPKRNNDD